VGTLIRHAASRDVSLVAESHNIWCFPDAPTARMMARITELVRNPRFLLAVHNCDARTTATEHEPRGNPCIQRSATAMLLIADR
jgi:hypothetical protein